MINDKKREYPVKLLSRYYEATCEPFRSLSDLPLAEAKEVFNRIRPIYRQRKVYC